MTRYRILFLFWLMALTLFRLWYIGSGALDLAPDEAHYWDWSRRLDLSYYSKGPMVAYLIAASTRLGGNREFFVRLPAVLLSSGTAILAYLLARELFLSERIAFFTVLILSLIPLYAAGSLLMTIDPPFIFFWALALLAFWKAVQYSSQQPLSTRWWVLFGLALGLGMLSKYTMALILPCLLLYLWFSPKGRPHLRQKGLYLAFLLGLLLFSPVLLWNAQHGWVSFRHVIGQAGLSGRCSVFDVRCWILEVQAPSVWTFLEFLGSQAGVISPLLFVAFVFSMGRSARLSLRRGAPLQKGRDEHLFLLLTSAPVLAFFLFWSFHSKVQANWAAPAYLTATIASAAWGEEVLGQPPRRSKRLAAASFSGLAIVPALTLLLFGHFPTLLDRVGIDLPPKVDPTRRLQGWRELGEAVGPLLQKMSQAHHTFIMSDRYQITSELAYETARLALADSLACACEALAYPECTALLGPVVP
ncbi:MAG: glycosyltransferase family 39 protein, partial [Candidatus Methylomirabilales bacterium]